MIFTPNPYDYSLGEISQKPFSEKISQIPSLSVFPKPLGLALAASLEEPLDVTRKGLGFEKTVSRVFCDGAYNLPKSRDSRFLDQKTEIGPQANSRAQTRCG